MRVVGKELRDAFDRIRLNGELAKVIGWRLAKVSQRIAADFHGGAFVGLGAMIMFKKVFFFWETTTEQAMEGILQKTVGCNVLALGMEAGLCRMWWSPSRI